MSDVRLLVDGVAVGVMRVWPMPGSCHESPWCRAAPRPQIFPIWIDAITGPQEAVGPGSDAGRAAVEHVGVDLSGRHAVATEKRYRCHVFSESRGLSPDPPAVVRDSPFANARNHTQVGHPRPSFPIRVPSKAPGFPPFVLPSLVRVESPTPPEKPRFLNLDRESQPPAATKG